MPRVVLLLPTSTYRAPDFVHAARALGVEIVVASEELPTLADPEGRRTAVVALDDPERAADELVALDARAPVDAVIAVDDRGVVAAARAGALLGFPVNPVEAVERTRDKAAMRVALAVGEIPQPRFAVGDDPEALVRALDAVGLPCVVKPVGLAASRGVIRADDPEGVRAAAERALAIAGTGPLLVEEFVPGDEIAVEALLRDGRLDVLAVFDKPDPLEGPYFEETIYVTPSRHDHAVLARAEQLVADAAAALGLREGPVHAELRVDATSNRMWIIEIAARTIGGLCARTLRFGAGISLEEVVLRHALQLPLDGLVREPAASGVMMLPIPSAGTLHAVRGRDEARAVPGIVGLEITIPIGRPVVPLPEGDRYLGFLFARGETPDEVEQALRTAHACLEFDITPGS